MELPQPLPAALLWPLVPLLPLLMAEALFYVAVGVAAALLLVYLALMIWWNNHGL